VTSPDVLESFYLTTRGHFTATMVSGWIKSPPFVIASVILNRASPGAVRLPSDWNADALEAVCFQCGFYGRPVRVDRLQAAELADMGTQILGLPSEAVNPPLNVVERQAIEHLVKTVNTWLKPVNRS
jgi:hypothetical protein